MSNNDNSNNNDNETPHPLAAVFAPKNSLSIPTAPRQIESHDYSHTKGARAVMKDGVLTTETFGVMRSTSADYAPTTSDTPFSKITDKSGWTSISVDQLKPDSRVTLRNGMEMTWKSAQDAGFVRLVNGRYVSADSSSAPSSAPAAAATPSAPAAVSPNGPSQHPDLVTEAFPSAHAEGALNALTLSTSPLTRVGTVRDYVEKGELSAARVGEIAGQLGAEPQQVHEALAPVVAAFKTQADAVVSSFGVEPESMYTWARENAPEKLNAAMSRHGNKRQTAGYADLTREYVSKLDVISPEEVLNADLGPGITVRQGPRGVIVRTPEGDFSWSSALRAGIIRLSRRS